MSAEVSDELLAIERACIGALVQAPDLRVEVPDLRAEHFTVGRHRELLHIVDDLVAVPAAGETEVVAEIVRRGCATTTGGAPYVHTCIEACPLPWNVPHYAAAVMDAARRRRVEQLGIRTVQAARSAQPIEDVLALVDDELVAVRHTARGTTAAPDLDAFLSTDDAPRDWILPGLLERRDRCIPTGDEGIGKSTLLRQIGHAAAAGVHPFTFEAIDPVTVLLIDLENSPAQIRRALHPLRDLAKPEPGRLRIEVRTQGLDLTDPDDRAWLRAQITAAKPDVVITGPIYKLISGDPIKEEPARMVVGFLDRLRADHDIALILEAHTPYATNNKHRPMRPYGASIWSRWPELGLHLAKTGRLTHWRPSRGEYDWPLALRRGTGWPFEIDDAPTDTTDGSADEIKPAARKLLEALRTFDEPVPNSRIVDAIKKRHGHGLTRETVSRELNTLLRLGLIDVLEAGQFEEKRWTATPTPETGTNAPALV